MLIRSLLIRRTEINVHVQLTDLQSSESVSVVQEASSRLTRAFSTFTFLATATLHVGGASQQQEVKLKFLFLYTIVLYIM